MTTASESARTDKDKRLNQLCKVIEYFRTANPTSTEAKLFFSHKDAENYIPSRTLDNHLYFLRRLNEQFGNPLPAIMPKNGTNPHKFSSYQFRNGENDEYFLLLALLAKLGQSILSNDGTHRAFVDIRKMLADASDQGENKSATYSHLDLLDKIHYKSSEFDAEPSISYENRLISIIDNIMQICRCLLKSNSIKCTYVNRNSNQKELHLQPYTLLRYNESWYLIAASTESVKDYRYYKVNRIRKLEIGEPFSSHDPKDLKKYLKKLDSVFGIDADLNKPTQTAHIRFSPEAEQLIKGIKWSNRQALIKDEKGLTITVDYKNSGELLGRILRYGEFAEVVEPAELREEWLGRIRKMAEKYLR